MTVHAFSVASTAPDGHKLEMRGVDLLRAVAVLAVVYTHISYYIRDDLFSDWAVLRLVDATLVQSAGLNRHLSFVGVAIFMMITGLVLTGSAMRQTPGRFLFNRVGRLMPALWVSVALAIALVWLGINTMFSRQESLPVGAAALSFVLGGFFLRPEVVVLGVTWTLIVQISFYLLCVAMRPLLRTAPILMPLIGAAICIGMLSYNHAVSFAWQVPMLSKVAATLPAIFIGQIIYLGWTRSAGWVWIAAAAVAQLEVVRLATDLQVYWAGSQYLWTYIVVVGAVLLLARHDGLLVRTAAVRWVATRSYAIYLLHTLILYRVYENTVDHLGPTWSVALFLLILGLASELMYRYVERPSTRWLALRRKPAGSSVGRRTADEAQWSRQES